MSTATNIQTTRIESREPPTTINICRDPVHDALNAIGPRYKSYRYRTHPVPDASPNTAVSTAAHHVLVTLLPAESARFDSELTRTPQTTRDGEVVEAGRRIGRAGAAG